MSSSILCRISTIDAANAGSLRHHIVVSLLHAILPSSPRLNLPYHHSFAICAISGIQRKDGFRSLQPEPFGCFIFQGRLRFADTP